MSAEILDDPRLVSRRERFWNAVLSDDQRPGDRIAVAEHDREIVGITFSGVPLDGDWPWAIQLYVLYLLSAFRGSGASIELLETVVPPTETAGLWVADPSPRAQMFDHKQGFRYDSTSQVKDEDREIRMTRILVSKSASSRLIRDWRMRV